MLASGINALKSFLNTDIPPNKVVEVKPDLFTSRNTCRRQDALVLYVPGSASSNKKDHQYEIVLHRPTTETMHHAYSLYRSPNKQDAEGRFQVLRDKLPLLVNICKEIYHTSGLQNICDALFERPSWTIAHLAAYFALNDAFKHPEVNMYLNSVEETTGLSPLQVAIIKQNLKTVEELISLDCSLEHLDQGGHSVLHYAASTSKEIIQLLVKNGAPSCLNLRNKFGYTPLHLACLADKPECVRALIVAGADVNITSNTEGNVEPSYVGNFLQSSGSNALYQGDMKYGGTPLHWACSKSVIEALVDMNCNIDAVNFQGKTALDVIVLRNRLDCAVALLSRGANPDIGDNDGNRPIHTAVKNGNVALIQCLIVFGADLDAFNNKGETARHLITKEQEPKILYQLAAVGARRCFSDMTGCTDGCAYNGSYEGIPPPRVVEPTNRDVLNQMLAVAAMDVASRKYKDGEIPKKGRLLCLDGGGIRGLILVQMLLELEAVLGKPIAHCFDWLAGTSTGGILALGIATGKTMKECLCLYFQMKEVTFVGLRPYSSEPLERVLKQNFGEETVMADIKHPRIMVTGVLADRKPVDLHLFRNYQSASEILDVKIESPYQLPLPPDQQHIWEVGRATGAAPTYFRAFGHYVDGGLIANNPTLDALTEIVEHCLALNVMGREEEACPVSVVVSLGTGVIPVSEIRNIDVFFPGGLRDGAKLIFGISALGNLIVDQATLSDGRVVDRARGWCSSIGVPFFRFSPQMSEEYAMDEKSDEKLCQMLWETKVYMRANMGVMRELADILTRS